MLAAFIDESYDNKDDVFALACVLANGDSLSKLCSGLDKVVLGATAYGVDSTAELHAWEMFHGQGEWKALKGKARAQVALYKRAFEVIAESGCDVLTRATVPSKLKVTGPHEITLRYLVEEIDRIAEQRGERVLIICDAVAESAQHRSALRMHKTIGTLGYKSRRLDRIVDTLHFADSHDSRGIQAADLVAFLLRRRIRNQTVPVDRREQIAIERVWSCLAESVIHHRTWP